MKTSLLVMSVIGIMSGLAGAQAMADDSNPFQSCKNLKLLDSGATDAQIKAAQDAAAPGCKVEAGLNVSMMGADTAAKAKISYFLHDVGEKQYLVDVNSRLDYWKQVKSCFENQSKPECAAQVARIKSAYSQVVGDLRIDLAQANGMKNVKGLDSSTIGPVKAYPDAIVGSGALDPSEATALKSITEVSPAAAKKHYGENHPKEMP